jgi:tetratricopeptide (TPR) repeat protein
MVYYNQGDYEKALEWVQKALEIREKVLGKENPDTAMTYNNIAGVYKKPRRL